MSDTSDKTNNEYFRYYNNELITQYHNQQHNKAITSLKNAYSTAYGNIIVRPNCKGIHKWKIKIHQVYLNTCVIGIDTAHHKWISNQFYNQQGISHFGYHSNGKKYDSKGKICGNYGFSFNSGDIVYLRLDCDNLLLSFSNNENALPNNKSIFKINKSKIGYSLAVYMGYKGNVVEIMSYQHNSTDDIIETKSNLSELDPLKKKNIRLHNDMIQMKITNQTQIQQLQQKIINQDCKMLSLRNERDSTQQTIANFKTQVEMLKQQNDKLMEENKEQQIEIKEYKFKIKALLFENQKLKMESIDVRKYKQWDNKQILLWMMSLDNGTFGKYEETLKKALELEEVTGDNLKDVDALDVKGWGIQNFGDRKCLIQHIQSLVQQNEQHNNDSAVFGVEGVESGAYI